MNRATTIITLALVVVVAAPLSLLVSGKRVLVHEEFHHANMAWWAKHGTTNLPPRDQIRCTYFTGRNTRERIWYAAEKDQCPFVTIDDTP